ncbi:MAG: hypothetical protein M3Z25_09780 [Actinomycetota bacterium]|nr:hypothetical protein [Actinomycetota bacterium]
MEEPTPSGIVAAGAELLIKYSDRGWLRLMDAHRDDGSGHCAACRGPVWPCTLWAIARHAQLLAGPGRRPPERR